MAKSIEVLSQIPEGLRQPLISEYGNIVNNYIRRNWIPTELHGARFCEIVYNIISGYSSGAYQISPNKPRNFVDACRSLENNTNVPRSFQILIPRLLPPLYEIRNNRNVGHVGGDVEPDYMDSTAVLSISSWIMAELIRVFHNTTTEEAQNFVDQIVERQTPYVWISGNKRRVLNATMKLKEQVLVLLSSDIGKSSLEDLFVWTEAVNKPHFMRILEDLHSRRLIEFNKTVNEIELSPTGYQLALKIIGNAQYQ